MNTDIVEGNKLIAEFMGYEKRVNVFDSRPVEYLMADYWVVPKNMQYHTSWDWLMPVVEKANTFLDNGDFEGLDIDIFRSMQDWIISVNIQNAWADLVTILTWYN